VLCVPADQCQLANAMLRAWMIGAVKRVFEPGCQMDYMLVLFGKQGVRKTSLWRALAGGYPYYNGIAAKNWTDPYRVHSAWIHECGELEGITTRAEISEIKAHLTEVGDNITLKYETQATIWLRRCVFCGTTNRDDFLRDETGARRFWIIESLLTSPLDATTIVKLRDMLWAEALAAYRNGDACYLADARMAAQQAEQAARYAPKDDPWEAHLDETLVKARVTHEPLRIASLLAKIGVQPEKQSRLDALRVADILRGYKFEKKLFRQGNEVFKAWWYPSL
jgi:predicted P-loop ATPase